MAKDINHITLIGRFSRDPEIKFTPTNTPVANFSLANNYSYNTSSGEKKESVIFFNCIAWGKGGQLIAQYCKKGQRIIVEGRLQQRSWQDKDGNNRSTIEIVVDNFQFLENAQRSAPPQSEAPHEVVEPEKYEDLSENNPFDDSLDIPF